MNKTILFLGASVIALTLANPSFAQSQSTPDLQNRVDDLEATIDALRAEIADIRKQPQFKGAPETVSSNGDYSFKIRGQLAADAATFSTRTGTKDLNSGTQLRRARLGVDGKVAKDWQYRFEADFSNASRDDNSNQEVDVKDAYVQYVGIENWKFTLGQQKTPNTLEQANSSSDTLFTEIPLFVEAFTNRTTAGGDYKAGISAYYTNVNWTATLGLFGENYAINGGGGTNGTSGTATATYKDEGWGPAGRVTWAPLNGYQKVVHLGASGYYRQTGGRKVVQFRTGPEISVDGTRLVDTGAVAADAYSFLGAELGAEYGPVFFQGEYGRTNINRTGVLSDVNFDGGYASISYVLTGENHDYKAGSFARIKPKKPFSLATGGWGAWELAARYSTLDLNDANIVGGKQHNYTGGVNWYPNDYVRVFLDYVRYDATKGVVRDKGDAVIARIGVIW